MEKQFKINVFSSTLKIFWLILTIIYSVNLYINKIHYETFLSKYFIILFAVYIVIVLFPQSIMVIQHYIFEKLKVKNHKREYVLQLKKSFKIIFFSGIGLIVINFLRIGLKL